MVLVLSLPKNFPHRELLVSMTFGVVILSILVHGLTMTPLLRWLGIVGGHQERVAYELTHGKLNAAKAALAEIDQMSRGHFTSPNVLTNLRNKYEQKIERYNETLNELHLEKKQLQAEELQLTKRHLLFVEKNAMNDAFHHGVLSQTAQDKLLTDIDAQLLSLESSEDTDDDNVDPYKNHDDEHNSLEGLSVKTLNRDNEVTTINERKP